MRFFCVACGFGIVVAAANFFSPHWIASLLQGESGNQPIPAVSLMGDMRVATHDPGRFQPTVENTSADSGNRSTVLDIELTTGR